MASVGEALRFARERIGAVDGRALVRYVTGLAHAQLAARPETELDFPAWRELETLVARRAAGEPVAYLIGWREFYKRRFVVNPSVLIPRPETELLIDMVLLLIDRPGSPRILDLGTGCGALAISLALELPGAALTATDISQAALRVARENAARLGADVRWVESFWYAALAAERFDLIVSNPPYVAAGDPHLGQGDLRFEPRAALVGRGAAGAGDLEQIVLGAPAHLGNQGRMLVEHGWDQAATVRDYLAAAGFDDIATVRDIGGKERVTGGVLRRQ